MKKKLVMHLLCFSMLSLQAFGDEATQATSKPNVIVIMADDLGYRDLGFQGSEVVKTPHLDELAATGVIFTDAHAASSVCSPSRAGFMTGRYQQRFGHEANGPNARQGMSTKEFTIGQAFQSQGYKTYLIGKWHLGGSEEMYPTKRGFDQFWGLRSGSRGYFYKDSEKLGNSKSIEHNGKHVKFEGFLTDRMTDAAINMIETDKGAPFFMFLSYTAPHTPLQATKEDLKKANGNPYHALIQNLDGNIGRLVAFLEEKKLRDNTVIWFLSDNGGTTGAASNYPLNGQKGVEFEGGHRVPFIINWPAGIKGGQRFNGLSSALDIFPTSYKLVGGSETPAKLDGVDLLPYLKGEKTGNPHEFLYFRKQEQAAVRTGTWKMIRAEGFEPMLYSMEKDMSELNDVGKQTPEKVEELSKLIAEWEKGLIDPLWGEGDYWAKVRKSKNEKFYHADKVYKTLGKAEKQLSRESSK